MGHEYAQRLAPGCSFMRSRSVNRQALSFLGTFLLGQSPKLSKSPYFNAHLLPHPLSDRLALPVNQIVEVSYSHIRYPERDTKCPNPYVLALGLIAHVAAELVPSRAHTRSP